jgi:hypothetical protein
LLDYFFKFRVSKANDHIFGLEIRMDDFANAMKIVQAHEYLLRNLSHQGQGDPLIVKALHDFEKVHTKNFEYHNEMHPVGPMVLE